MSQPQQQYAENLEGLKGDLLRLARKYVAVRMTPEMIGGYLREPHKSDLIAAIDPAEGYLDLRKAVEARPQLGGKIAIFLCAMGGSAGLLCWAAITVGKVSPMDMHTAIESATLQGLIRGETSDVHVFCRLCGQIAVRSGVEFNEFMGLALAAALDKAYSMASEPAGGDLAEFESDTVN